MSILKKAFDSVNHDRLLEVVYNEGVKGKFFCALKAMYGSLISCVRVNGDLSDYFECPSGVRQGCVMSPTLFSLFINQLANHINSSGVHGAQILPNLLELFIVLFADDVALIATTPRGLQAQLNILKNCCNNLKLTVNIDKTKIVVFRKGGFLGKKEKWFYDGQPIEVVDKYCYLGFVFTPMLSLKRGTSHLVLKGKRANSIVSRAFFNCKEMSQSIYFRIFDSKVQSTLLYASELWGFERLDNLETVHLNACKRFLGVPLKTPTKMVYAELARFPLFVNTRVRCLKYWFRLICMDNSRLPKQAYLMQLHMDTHGKRCWVTEIRELLSSAGFMYVWLNQGVQNVNAFLSVFKQRLKDMFIQECSEVIREKERYKLYSTFKDSFGISSYLNTVNIYCLRVALSQMRFGVIPINNNMHRYTLNIRQRMCPFCLNQVEDEYHFLYVCNEYSDLRKRFLSDIGDMSLAEVLCSNNSTRTLLVAKFVFYAFKRRRIIVAE